LFQDKASRHGICGKALIMMAAQERDKNPTQPVTTGKSSDRGFLRLPAFGFFKRFFKVPAAAWARIAGLIGILA